MRQVKITFVFCEIKIQKKYLHKRFSQTFICLLFNLQNQKEIPHNPMLKIGQHSPSDIFIDIQAFQKIRKIQNLQLKELSLNA